MESSGMTPKISVPPKPSPIECKRPLQGKNGVGITNPSLKNSYGSIPSSCAYSCPKFSQTAEMAQQYPRFRIRPTRRFNRKGLQIRPILGRRSRKRRQKASVRRCHRPTAVQMLGFPYRFQISRYFQIRCPSTGFFLIDFLSGPISAKRNRLPSIPKQRRSGRPRKKNRVEGDLFFFF